MDFLYSQLDLARLHAALTVIQRGIVVRRYVEDRPVTVTASSPEVPHG